MSSSDGVEIIDLTGPEPSSLPSLQKVSNTSDTPKAPPRRNGIIRSENVAGSSRLSRSERRRIARGKEADEPQLPNSILDEDCAVEASTSAAPRRPRQRPRRKARANKRSGDEREEGEMEELPVEVGKNEEESDKSTSHAREVNGGVEHVRNGQGSSIVEGSRQRKRRKKDKESPPPPDNLFVLDPGPSEHVSQPQQTEVPPTTIEPKVNADTNAQTLILPSHVTVHSGDTEALPVVLADAAVDDTDADDFIQYMDYDETQRGVTRYFDNADEVENRKTTFLCKHCGAEGDHKTSECPVQICLTCGAHNEHSTRGCPISKVCFTCNMKGHINKDCPNRFKSHRSSNMDRFYDCDRCGSSLHVMKECPTLWRIYEYVSDEQRDLTLSARQGKESLPLGEGGEGYIGQDLWCYNCGEEGHLGDDCNMRSRPPDFPREPSAFGRFNILSGPFADAVAPIQSRSRKQRDWEMEGNFDDGYGFSGPSDVGKRGRDKEKERMRLRADEARHIDDEDEDDWFGSREGRPKGPTNRPPPLGPKAQRNSGGRNDSRAKKSKPSISINFNKTSQQTFGKKPNGLALSDRLGMDVSRSSTPKQSEGRGDGRHSKGSKSDNRQSSKSWRDRERDRDRDRDKDRGSGRRHSGESGRDSAAGRRYYGGYGR